jgi:hypothetical protein
MLIVERNNEKIEINDDYKPINAGDINKDVIKFALTEAEATYSVSDGFFAYFFADILKGYGFKIIKVEDIEEKETDLQEVIY